VLDFFVKELLQNMLCVVAVWSLDELKLALFWWQVKKAFLALAQNGVRAAALWDSVRQDFVGTYSLVWTMCLWLAC